MDLILKNNQLDIVEQKNMMDIEGKKIYKNNKFYREFINIMEHPMTNSFINEYIKTIYDMYTVYLFIDVYNKLNKHLEYKNIVLNGYQKLFLISNIFKNKDLKKHLIYKYMEEFGTTKINHNTFID